MRFTETALQLLKLCGSEAGPVPLLFARFLLIWVIIYLLMRMAFVCIVVRMRDTYAERWRIFWRSGRQMVAGAVVSVFAQQLNVIVWVVVMRMVLKQMRIVVVMTTTIGQKATRWPICCLQNTGGVAIGIDFTYLRSKKRRAKSITFYILFGQFPDFCFISFNLVLI